MLVPVLDEVETMRNDRTAQAVTLRPGLPKDADSSIYISAIVFGGKSLTLLDMALERQIEFAISNALRSETLRILRDKFHRTPEQLEDADRFIQSITRHVYPTDRTS